VRPLGIAGILGLVLFMQLSQQFFSSLRKCSQHRTASSSRACVSLPQITQTQLLDLKSSNAFLPKTTERLDHERQFALKTCNRFWPACLNEMLRCPIDIFLLGPSAKILESHVLKKRVLLLLCRIVGRIHIDSLEWSHTLGLNHSLSVRHGKVALAWRD
jgi:hypothetical protein